MRPTRMHRSALAATLGIVLVLTGCTSLGMPYDESGGHRGRVVDAITGRGLNGAKVYAGDPSMSDRRIKTKGDGDFYFHFKGVPTTMKIERKGYKLIEIPTRRFLRTDVFEMQIDDTPKSPLWHGKRDDIYSQFERDLLKRRGSGQIDKR